MKATARHRGNNDKMADKALKRRAVTKFMQKYKD